MVQSPTPFLARIAPAFDSQIVSALPEIFTEFRGKRIALLWRGSRDGFNAGDFHRCCDRHPNTLTLIQDTSMNVFGGFSPVAWESPIVQSCKGDPSLKSFIFTLTNPHNVPPRKFSLKPEKGDWAISCYSQWGPSFRDISVRDNCHETTSSYTLTFGSNYTNDAWRDGEVFFTGSKNFQVKEIEVFEIFA
jgi:hypothetical protein